MRRMVREDLPAPAATSLARRLRPWALPILTLFIAYWMFGRGTPGFDLVALRDDFREGRPEAALERLARAPADDLPPELAGRRWWPREERARALSDLAATPSIELLEDAAQPTLVHPLDKLLAAPAEVRLREAQDDALLLVVRNTDMNLEAGTYALEPGQARVVLDVPLLPGATYLLTLSDPASGAPRALAGFQWVPEAAAQETTRAMTAAHALAGDSHEGASLLAALAALQRGFTSEALQRLQPLRERPGYERLATELTALTLSRQGLDLSARRLLAP